MSKMVKIRRKANYTVLSKSTSSVFLGVFLLVIAGLGGSFLYFWKLVWDNGSVDADFGRFLQVADFAIYGAFAILGIVAIRGIGGIFSKEIFTITQSQLSQQNFPFGFPKKKSLVGLGNFYIQEQERYPYNRGLYYYHIATGDPAAPVFVMRNIMDQELSQALVQELNSRTAGFSESIERKE